MQQFAKCCIDEGRIVFTTVVELSYSCYIWCLFAHFLPQYKLCVISVRVVFATAAAIPNFATSGHAGKEAPGDVLFFFGLAVCSKRHMRDEHS